MMDVTAIIPSYKRPNLSQILGSLRDTGVKEIWVVNDDPDKILELEGVRVFNMGVNCGSICRIAIALMAKTTHVLCHDDDVVLERPENLANLMAWQETYPEAIVGYYGRQCKWDSEKPYTDGVYMAGASYPDPQPINIVFGKMMLAKTSKYAQAWGLWSELKDCPPEEDILPSLANLIAGYQNYVVPVKGKGCLPLHEWGHSLSGRRDFWEIRDRAVNCIAEGRWGSEGRAAASEAA